MSSARIEELRKKFDENPRRYFAPLANEYRKAGDFDQAIFICQEYLPQQPGHMSGHIVFGQALFEAKRLPEAKQVFETALSLDPENLIALRHLADISRDLGDIAAARTWYDRVLHADPRNEEVQAIMEKLGSTQAAAAAPTAEVPAPQVPPAAPIARTLPDSASAPTMELSAAAVQEMIKARQAAKAPPAPSAPATPAAAPQPPRPTEPETISILDATPTVEIHAVTDTAPIAGLEPTSQAGTFDMPAFEPLGLETNAAPGEHAPPPTAPPPTIDALDTISLDLSMPGEASPAPAVPAATPPVEAPAGDDGLLDLGTFSMGGETAAPAAAAPSPVDTPIDGGHEAAGDLIDLDFASAPDAPKEELSVPTMIIDAVKSVPAAVQEAVSDTIPLVMDAMETVAPAMMDFVDTTVPSVIETVQEAVAPVVEAVAETPTMIIEAIKAPPAAEPFPPPPAPEAATPRGSQSVPFVTETMAQLYLSQGHRVEAMDIYRKLIDARPDDAELKAKLAAIQAEETAARAPSPAPTPVAAPAAPPSAPRRFSGSGPSIRTVLRDLFQIDASVTASNGASAAGASGEVGSIDMLFSAEPVADALSPLAIAFDGGYVATQGTIDELFAGGAQ